MSGALHLVGGGWGGDGAVWRGFLEHAAERAGGAVPRVLVVAVREHDGALHASKLVQTLRAAGRVEAVVRSVRPGEVLGEDAFDDGLHGVLVGGGSAPAYLDALVPHAARLRALIEAGTPYAGFSAGAMIAPERAVAGGWLREGLPVLGEDASEDLGEIEVREGLGLVPFSVDVHAAQRGTLSRLVTAVEGALVPWGVAIDEDTALVVQDGAGHVEGAGNVWWVEPGEDAVAVRRETGRGGPRPLRAQR